MIILVTGQPGGGKTAHAVDMLAHDDQFKGRPLFVMGVPDLTIEHTPCPPVGEWTVLKDSPEDENIKLPYFTFPENAVVLIDEAQRVYRPRQVGSAVPPYVAAFETHRHTGVDFVLITQHAGLIDSNIRKLVGRHIHIRVTALGRYRYEWTELGDPESASSRELAARTKYTLPKRAFSLYKSSQLHTKIKPKIPAYVYIFAIASVLAVLAGIYVWKRIGAQGEEVAARFGHDSPTTTASAISSPKSGETLTVPEYLEAQIPRVAGLHHTAPRYDELTKPTDAPWPVGCYTVGDKCKCNDQQGNRYVTTDSLCRQIVQNGIFKDWGQRNETQGETRRERAGARPESDPVPPPQPPALAALPTPEPAPAANPRPIPQDSPWRFKG